MPAGAALRLEQTVIARIVLRAPQQAQQPSPARGGVSVAVARGCRRGRDERDFHREAFRIDWTLES